MIQRRWKAASKDTIDVVADSLCFRLGSQLGKVISLASGDVCLALSQGELGLVPSLLGDLLRSLLGVSWIRADAGVGLLVDGFNLTNNKRECN